MWNSSLKEKRRRFAAMVFIHSLMWPMTEQEADALYYKSKNAWWFNWLGFVLLISGDAKSAVKKRLIGWIERW